MNIYYQCGLRKKPNTLLRRHILSEHLAKQGRTSEEIKEIDKLSKDQESWLFHAEKMRHHSTHVWGVARTFYRGGAQDGETRCRNPVTDREVGQDAHLAFREWVENMDALLERLRGSAIEANRDRLYSPKESLTPTPRRPSEGGATIGRGPSCAE